MDATFDPKHLAAALGMIRAICGSGSVHKPITRFAKMFAADRGEASLMATNCEACVVTKIGCQTAKQGHALVSVSRATSFASIAGGEVRIKVEGGGTTMQSAKARWTEQTDSIDDFPAVVHSKWSREFSPEPKLLAESISAAAEAADRETNRYALSGVRFEGPTLRIIGTDGRRIFMSDHAIECGDLEAIVPTNYAKAVASILAEASECAVLVGDRHLGFRVGATEIAVPLLEGRYPRTEHFFNIANPVDAKCDADALAAAARCALMSVELDKKELPTAFLSVAGGQLQISRTEAGQSSLVECAIDGAPDGKYGAVTLPYLRAACSSGVHGIVTLRFEPDRGSSFNYHILNGSSRWKVCGCDPERL